MKWCSVKFQLFDIHRMLLAMLPSGNNLPLAMLPSDNNLPLTIVPSGNNRHFLYSQVATTDTSCVPKWQQPTLPVFPSGNNRHFLYSEVATTDTSCVPKWQQPTLPTGPPGVSTGLGGARRLSTACSTGLAFREPRMPRNLSTDAFGCMVGPACVLPQYRHSPAFILCSEIVSL